MKLKSIPNCVAVIPPIMSQDSNDKSDRKSLDNLMSRLNSIASRSPQMKQTLNRKVFPSTSGKSKRTKYEPLSPIEKRSKRKRAEPQSNKINSWLQKENTKKQRDRAKQKSDFDKYGVRLPSYEQIVSDQKKFAEHKVKLAVLESLVDDSLDKSISIVGSEKTKRFSGPILDCKEETFDELDKAFLKHCTRLKKIMNGKIHFEKHERFYNRFKNMYSNDKSDSASLILYNQEQIDHLMYKLKDKFDPEDLKMQYFFNVLLPELCLLIFMDVHEMSRTKALSYLEKRPFDDDIED